jgi:RimJ/RimL family protein N-acetyltransferase
MKYRLIHKILSILRIKFLEVVYVAPHGIRGPEGFETDIVSANRLRELSSSGVVVYGEDDISRIEKGIAICITVFDQGRLAGICWYAIKNYPHTTGYTANIHPDCICGYGLRVFDGYQGRGIHAVLVQKVLSWMDSNNKNDLILAINFDNQASRKSAEKMGFRKLGWSFYSPWFKFRGLAKVTQYYSIDLG